MCSTNNEEVQTINSTDGNTTGNQTTNTTSNTSTIITTTLPIPDTIQHSKKSAANTASTSTAIYVCTFALLLASFSTVKSIF